MPKGLARERYLLLLLLLCAFAGLPLLAPGYFLKAHDAPHTLFFLNAFDQALRDGYLIPQWGPDFALGYGYPLFIFYSPLAYGVAEAFHLLGASLTLAGKLTYLIAFIGSGLAMYAFVRRLFGRAAGLLAGLLYVYVPYHLVDVYVRCDLAESFAYIFMPLTLLAFLHLVEDGDRRHLAWAGLSYAGLVLAHNSTAMIFTPLLMAYVAFLCLHRGRRAGLRPAVWAALCALAGAVLAAGISAFFLLPVFLERSYIVQEQWISGSFNYLKHFIYPAQFLSPFWGFGYAGEGLADEMPFQLGLAPLLFALAGLVLAWRAPRRRGDRVFFLLATLVALFLMLPLSAALWGALPLAALVQFPWRLLILTAVSLSVLGGTLAAPSEKEGTPLSGAPLLVLCLLIVLGSYAYTLPQYTERSERAESPAAVIDFELVYPPDRTGMMAWTQEQPMTSPLVPQYLAGEPLTKAHVLQGDATVEMLRHGGSSEDIRVVAQTPATIEFYTYYFPGWQARLDDEPVSIRPSGRFGLIALDVPAGEHHVSLRFGDTPVRSAGKALSAASALLALGLLAWPRRVPISLFKR